MLFRSIDHLDATAVEVVDAYLWDDRRARPEPARYVAIHHPTRWRVYVAESDIL